MRCVFCKARYQKGSGLTFHKFPTDSTKKLWLRALNIADCSLKPSDMLCSQHFTDDCLIRHTARTSLKNGAVPTLFSGPNATGTQEESTNVPLIIKNIECESENTPRTSKILLQHDTVEIKSEIISSPCDTTFNPPPCVSWTIVDVKTEPSEPSTSGTQEEYWPVPVIENVKQEPLYEYIQPRTNPELCESIRHDHGYGATPRTTSKALQHVKEALKISQARVKALTQCVKRLKSNICSLKAIVYDLTKDKLIINDLCQYQDFEPGLSKKRNRKIKKKKMGM